MSRRFWLRKDIGARRHAVPIRIMVVWVHQIAMAWRLLHIGLAHHSINTHQFITHVNTKIKVSASALKYQAYLKIFASCLEQIYDEGYYGPTSTGVPPVPFVRVVKRRTTANKKERRRTQSINSAFTYLRDCIPNVPSDTKLSKVRMNNGTYHRTTKQNGFCFLRFNRAD